MYLACSARIAGSAYIRRVHRKNYVSPWHASDGTLKYPFDLL
ncbi:hypothetical protein ASZ90_015809 [hydrocarbon metagenome]|uniref:Uncharacterized protein n=1 Tax=hydrocarbon metagenome TaxID=938273 RepID=A0A0W8F0Y7_9ZZZZ